MAAKVQGPPRLKLWIHEPNYYKNEEELVLNQDVMPGIKAGDFLEISHPDRPETRLVVEVQHKSLAAGKQLKTAGGQISVDRLIADVFKLQNRGEVAVQRVDPDIISLDMVELFFKDQYIGRSDMWRLKATLMNSCAYPTKKVTFAGVRAQVAELWKDGARVTSGLISERTKVVFRSCSAQFYIFLQMSAEMWEFSMDGDLHCERLVDGFLSELFARWRELKCNHDVSIILFSRTYYDSFSLADFAAERQSSLQQDTTGQVYEDFYTVAIHHETRADWTGALVQLKREIAKYPSTINCAAATSAAASEPRGRNSSSMRANFLEAINLALNAFDRHYIDRNFERTGQMIVVVSAGAGAYEVDANLTNVTKQRMIDSGIGCDLVCLTKPPLHIAPVFRFKRADIFNTSQPMYNTPHWINASYYGAALLDDADAAELPKLQSMSTSSAAPPSAKDLPSAFHVAPRFELVCRLHDRAPAGICGADGCAEPSADVGAAVSPLVALARAQDCALVGIEGMRRPSAIDRVPAVMLERAATPQSQGSARADTPVQLGPMSASPGAVGPLSSVSNASSSVQGTYRVTYDTHDAAVFAGEFVAPMRPKRIRRVSGSEVNLPTVASVGSLSRSLEQRTGAQYLEAKFGAREDSTERPFESSSLDDRTDGFTQNFGRRDGADALSVLTDRSPAKSRDGAGHVDRSAAFDVPPKRRSLLGAGLAVDVPQSSVALSSAMPPRARGISTTLANDVGSRGGSPVGSLYDSEYGDDVSTFTRGSPGTGEATATMRRKPSRTYSMESGRAGPVVAQRPGILHATSSRQLIGSVSGVSIADGGAGGDRGSDFARAINPFKPTSALMSTGRVTSNRRRWSHIFPVGSGWQQVEPNWKSLSTPGSLPLTTDYFPNSVDLGRDYLENTYSLALDDDDRDSNIYGNRTEAVLKELVSQRLAQGFQIIVSTALDTAQSDQTVFGMEGADGAGAGEGKQRGLVPSQSGPRSALTAAVTGGQAGMLGAGSSVASVRTSPGHSTSEGASARSAGSGVVMGFAAGGLMSGAGRATGATTAYYMSMGHTFHKLVFDPRARNIEVRRYMKRYRPTSRAIPYRYVLRAPLQKEPQCVMVEFRQQAAGDYNWNYLDQLICGYYADLVESLRYWRARFVLLPMTSNTKKGLTRSDTSAGHPAGAGDNILAGMPDFAAEQEEEEARIANFAKFLGILNKLKAATQPRAKDDLGVNIVGKDGTSQTQPPAGTQGASQLVAQPSQAQLQRDREREREHREKEREKEKDAPPVQAQVQQQFPAAEPVSKDADLSVIVGAMQHRFYGVAVEDRRHHLRTYKNCFVGRECVDWMLKRVSDLKSRDDAVALGRALMGAGFIEHVTRAHPFQDGAFLYVFKHAKTTKKGGVEPESQLAPGSPQPTTATDTHKTGAPVGSPQGTGAATQPAAAPAPQTGSTPSVASERGDTLAPLPTRKDGSGASAVPSALQSSTTARESGPPAMPLRQTSDAASGEFSVSINRNRAPDSVVAVVAAAASGAKNVGLADAAAAIARAATISQRSSGPAVTSPTTGHVDPLTSPSSSAAQARDQAHAWPDRRRSLAQLVASSSDRDKPVALTRSLVLDIDPQKKSDRREWLVVHYDAFYDPSRGHHLEVHWLVSTGCIVEELVQTWSRKAAQCSILMVPVPCEQPLPDRPECDPFRAHIHVPLAWSPDKKAADAAGIVDVAAVVPAHPFSPSASAGAHAFVPLSPFNRGQVGGDSRFFGTAFTRQTSIPRGTYGAHGTHTNHSDSVGSTTSVSGGLASLFPSRRHYFEEALLARFDFMLDTESDIEVESAFEESGRQMVFSYRRPEFRHPQYIHRTGAAIVQVLDAGAGFLFSSNPLMTNKWRASAGTDAAVNARILSQLSEFCANAEGLEAFWKAIVERGKRKRESAPAPGTAAAANFDKGAAAAASGEAGTSDGKYGDLRELVSEMEARMPKQLSASDASPAPEVETKADASADGEAADPAIRVGRFEVVPREADSRSATPDEPHVGAPEGEDTKRRTSSGAKAKGGASLTSNLPAEPARANSATTPRDSPAVQRASASASLRGSASVDDYVSGIVGGGNALTRIAYYLMQAQADPMAMPEAFARRR